ncbi:MAG TPA: CinA family protein [Candidatus Limiplasma sp.]|nr:CinA family protein [Candidatus Limiplasma sp.]HPS81436.1 CinA family protein [Candidatus Limiplasma sp.]
MSTLYTLAEAVVQTAVEKGVTLGTAESLTAGLIASTIAEVPGASRTLLGGIVSYDPKVKRDLLHVPQSVIDGVGVVSEPCARQMAEGARQELGADITVSATGLAGPAGGTPQTPVGTVFIGCATSAGTAVEECHFSGNRQAVREQATARALEHLLQSLQA